MHPSELGRRIREVRTRKGISLRELSRLAEMAPASLSALENSKSSPTMASLHKILRVLGTDFAEFFSPENEESREVVFPAEGMKVLEDLYRRYTFALPKREDIRFEAILEEISSTENESDWETLDCDMAGIVLEGGPLILEMKPDLRWSLKTGDAFYVREGHEHRAVNTSGHPVRIITIYDPPRY